jgi:hypothetical protein
MFLLVLLAFSGGQALATTITPDDIFAAAVTTTNDPHGTDEYLWNLGDSSLTVGIVTVTGTNVTGTPPAAVLTDLSYWLKESNNQEGGIGIDAFADATKEKGEYKSINNDEKLDIAFSSPQTVNTIVVGRYGASDGDVAISGFTSDPGATAVNAKYDGTPGNATILYDAGTGVVTFSATQFGYIEVAFASATDISLLQLYQVGGGNDGFVFESVTFVPEPATLLLLGLGSLAMRRSRK